MFESIPDLSDNTRAVFDEMLRMNINKEYKLVWWVQNEKVTLPRIKGVKYVSARQRLLFWYYRQTSVCLICCNRFLKASRKGQFSIYLSHGITIKSVRSYYNVPDEIDYLAVASPSVVDLQSHEFNFDKTRAVPLGFPRNDVFADTPIDIKRILDTTCEKVIVWYPTFRQHKNGMIAGGDSMPIIHDIEMARRLNDVAKKHKVLIVFKPHFIQDLSYIEDLRLSNILFIKDDFFVTHNVSSYGFVGACNALISDYSSIYFDYTLCDKPIGVIWEDIEEYKRSPGLIANYEHYLRGAEKLYTFDDLKDFVIRISRGEDVLKQERREVMNEVNISTDGKNSARVINFIFDKIDELNRKDVV